MLFISIKESTVKYIPLSESVKLFSMQTKAFCNLLKSVSDTNIYFIKSKYLLLQILIDSFMSLSYIKAN